MSLDGCSLLASHEHTPPNLSAKVMSLSQQNDSVKPFLSRAARRFMDSLFAFPRFAHHPDCSCFDAHVLRIGQLVLCLGCTCLAAGALSATAILLLLFLSHGIPSGWHGTIAYAVTGICFYAPTRIQPFCQQKSFKISARFLLGIATAVLCVGGLVLPPLDATGYAARVAFVVIFRWVYTATLKQRAKWTPDPCSRCVNSVYPFCQDNRPRVISLVAELRQQAGTEDAAFVAFAAALAGDDTLGASVDVTTMRALVGKRSTPCHWGED